MKCKQCISRSHPTLLVYQLVKPQKEPHFSNISNFLTIALARSEP
jgi:hypothetical protein